jgi:catechol 2,3-dioxygenase-like lactoylglutathione lyase family enzyme
MRSYGEEAETEDVRWSENEKEDRMIRGIDHVVIAVRDLEAASADYRRLGFTVTPGGEHTGGATHNALISFADGAYFELIAFREPDREQDHKWWAKLARGEGSVDFALLSDDLATDAERLRAAGVTVDGPTDGGRLRPDGERIAWRSITLAADDVPLPFAIEDVTARELRVPPGTATEHPIASPGVAGVVVLVPDLDRATRAYEALLAAPGEASDPRIEGVRRARRFRVGPHWIELAEPEADADGLRRFIDERGAAPYRIVILIRSAPVDWLPVAQAHGADIRFAPANPATP